MSTPHLHIQDLHVTVHGKPIVQGVNLEIRGGEVHAIMGPGGTGKSTLAQAVMGHPRYEVTAGSVMLDEQNLLNMSVDRRARAGLFLAMQDPSEIQGVSNSAFIRTAMAARRTSRKEMPVLAFHRRLGEKMEELGLDPLLAERSINEGFSHDEKRRNEILQMMMLQPRIALLDDIDSGLDQDALQLVAKAVNDMRGPEVGLLIITQSNRLLEYIEPDVVHVLMNGKIVHRGGKELAVKLEEQGYDWLNQTPEGGEPR